MLNPHTRASPYISHHEIHGDTCNLEEEEEEEENKDGSPRAEMIWKLVSNQVSD